MRLFDLVCPKCGIIAEDVWDSDLPKMHCRTEMEKIWRRAPMVDAKMPFYVSGFGRKFSSHLQMERYARKKGKTVMTQSQAEALTIDTPEERIEKGLGEKRREVIRKSAYRLRYGYRDFPPLEKE